MALKNSTGFRVTTRDLLNACDPKELTAEDIKPTLEFLGIVDNKAQVKVSIDMKVNGYEVNLSGEPLISLNHFELKLTGNSARLSPEEAEKIKKRIEDLQHKLEMGVMPTDEELA